VSANAYRKLFRDIVQGYSEAQLGEDSVYIKHFSTHDQVSYNDTYDKYFEIAQARELPTEREILEFQKKEGFWTDEDDDFIERQEMYISAMRANKKALILKSAIDSHNARIKESQAQLNEKLDVKNKLIGNCCEKYAMGRANDHYVIEAVFKDKKCKKEYYTEEEAETLNFTQIAEILQLYNSISHQFREVEIQRLILQDFFYIYFPFSDNTVGFFGKPIVELTDNQLKLVVYTRVFKNIFEKYDNIPERIRKDPEALLDFGAVSDESRDKARTELTKDAPGASTLVGATAEDLEYLGVAKPEGKSLHEAAMEKGGNLSMEDLMKLHGA